MPTFRVTGIRQVSNMSSLDAAPSLTFTRDGNGYHAHYFNIPENISAYYFQWDLISSTGDININPFSYSADPNANAELHNEYLSGTGTYNFCVIGLTGSCNGSAEGIILTYDSNQPSLTAYLPNNY